MTLAILGTFDKADHDSRTGAAYHMEETIK